MVKSIKSKGKETVISGIDTVQQGFKSASKLTEGATEATVDIMKGAGSVVNGAGTGVSDTIKGVGSTVNRVGSGISDIAEESGKFSGDILSAAGNVTNTLLGSKENKGALTELLETALGVINSIIKVLSFPITIFGNIADRLSNWSKGNQDSKIVEESNISTAPAIEENAVTNISEVDKREAISIVSDLGIKDTDNGRKNATTNQSYDMDEKDIGIH